MAASRKKSVAYNIRYASGLVLVVLLFVFNPSMMLDALHQHATLGTLAVAIAALFGFIFYYLYRAYLYYFFMALCDLGGANNYRNYIRERFDIPGNWYWSTVKADELFVAVGKKSVVTEREQSNFAAVHLFYQSSTLALLLSVVTLYSLQIDKAAIFFLICVTFGAAAHAMNNSVEREDLIFLKTKSREMESAAKAMGLQKRRNTTNAEPKRTLK
jgi:hypothetical protein